MLKLRPELIIVTDDKKGKHQSWEARLEYMGDGGSFYLFAYGDCEEECRSQLQVKSQELIQAITEIELAGADDFSATILPTRLDWLKEGIIDIRSVFSEAKSGFVYDVRTDKDNISNAEILSCHVLIDDLLPVAGEFLKFPGDAGISQPEELENANPAIDAP